MTLLIRSMTLYKDMALKVADLKIKEWLTPCKGRFLARLEKPACGARSYSFYFLLRHDFAALDFAPLIFELSAQVMPCYVILPKRYDAHQRSTALKAAGLKSKTVVLCTRNPQSPIKIKESVRFTESYG